MSTFPASRMADALFPKVHQRVLAALFSTPDRSYYTCALPCHDGGLRTLPTMTQAAFSAPSERNKQPIFEVLRPLLPTTGQALEIASGTGQHVSWFAAHLPQWHWQPTDLTSEFFDSIAQRTQAAQLSNVGAPRTLDVRDNTWPLSDARYDLIYCANMLHIAPWACCAGLMQGAARHLAPQGLLVTYGPYLEGEVPTAASNLAFDQSLRARDPAWGLRRREDVAQEAQRAGLRLVQRFAMPANNLLLVWAAEQPS